MELKRYELETLDVLHRFFEEARDAWIEKDWSLVLRLLPATTIRRQTAEEFMKAGHLYRRAGACSTSRTAPTSARRIYATTAASWSATSRPWV